MSTPAATRPGPRPHPLLGLVALPGVAEAVEDARRACEELRWHRGLRRGWVVARTEAGIRSARADAALDGLRVPLDVVRDAALGAVTLAGAEAAVVGAALRVHAEVERHAPAPGATTGPRVPFRQLLARLHLAATGTSAAGRPRGGAAAGEGEGAGAAAGEGGGAGAAVGELGGLGPAPAPGEVAHRLAALADVVDHPPSPEVPALVTAAVAHGEILALRPFDIGNGLVARGVFRHLLTAGGVDPVGVVVPAVAWTVQPLPYVATAARFAHGTPDGVAAWLVTCARAVVTGAQEGRVVADAVLAGRLDGSPAP